MKASSVETGLLLNFGSKSLEYQRYTTAKLETSSGEDDYKA
jgi:hypothetical protein